MTEQESCAHEGSGMPAIWGGFPRRKLLAYLRHIAIACLLVAAPTLPAKAEDILTLQGRVAEFSSGRSVLLQGSTLYFDTHDALTGQHRFVAADVQTRQTTTLAEGLGNFSILAASDRYVAIRLNEEGGRIAVFDQTNRSEITLCCIKSIWPTYFVDDTLRMVASEGTRTTITTFDLKAGGEPRKTNVAARGKAVGWGDKLVLVDQNRSGDPLVASTLTVFDRNFNLVGSTPIPSQLTRAHGNCDIGPAMTGSAYLVYVSDCGHINIFNLESMRFERTLPYFSDAKFYSIALADGVIFAAPRLPSENVAAFELADGRQLATLPIEAPLIATNGRDLVAIRTDTHDTTNIDVYTYDLKAIRDKTRGVAAITERCDRAAVALRNSEPVQSALNIIESETVGPLVDGLETVDARGAECATTYARLLSRTIDRISEGVAIFEKLLRRSPEDRRLTAYLTAARNRLELHDGTFATPRFWLNSAPNEIRSPETASRELTIGIGTDWGPRDVTISGERVYVTEMGDVGGAGVTCATVLLYDRADFNLETILPIAGCDDDFQDEITSLVEGSHFVYVGLQYRYEQPDRTDLVTIHRQHPNVTDRLHLMGGISQLVASPEGLITCSINNSCALRDWDDVELPAQPVKPVICRPKGSAFPAEVGAEWLSKILDRGGRAIACDQRFLAVRAGNGDNAPIDFYGADSTDRPLAEVTAPWSEVSFLQDPPRAIVSGVTVDRLDFRSVDLEQGRVRPEISLQHDWDIGSAWTVYRNFLLIGRGSDLVVHDLVRGTTLAYLTKVVSAGKSDGHGVQRHRVAKLIVDDRFDRLIIVTVDGHNSQIISLPRLLSHLADHPTIWEQMDQILAAD